MNQKKLLIIIFGALALFIFGAYKIWENAQFRVLQTTPSITNTISTSTSVIKIDFSHDLSDEVAYNHTLILDGQSIVNEVERHERSLYIRIFELEEGKTYKISFAPIKSTNGNTIDKLRLEFKAVFIPYERLSQAQKELEAGETDRFEAEDPVLEFIPYSTLGYSLEPVNGVSEEGSYELLINLKIFLSNADRGYEQEATEAYKNQAFEYLRSNDINPESYKFNYLVQQPAY